MINRPDQVHGEYSLDVERDGARRCVGRRQVKHQWLYLNRLDTVTTLEQLVAFYVEQHNTQLPHSAFRGQTPDEMYFGTGANVPRQLEAARVAAMESRLKENRQQNCQVCADPEESLALS